MGKYFIICSFFVGKKNILDAELSEKIIVVSIPYVTHLKLRGMCIWYQPNKKHSIKTV